MSKEPRMGKNKEGQDLDVLMEPKNGLQANFKRHMAMWPAKSKA